MSYHHLFIKISQCSNFKDQTKDTGISMMSHIEMGFMWNSYVKKNEID